MKKSIAFVQFCLICAVMIAVSCSFSITQQDEAVVPVDDIQEETSTQAKLSAIDKIMPIVQKYVENGEAEITGYHSEELNAGRFADIPDIIFVSDTAETEFYEECEAALENALGDSYRYVCENI